jgi:hypothetical protein
MRGPLISAYVLLHYVVHCIGKGALRFLRSDRCRRYQEFVLFIGIFAKACLKWKNQPVL